jgi:hypothetical protein
MDPNVINETLTYFLLYKEAKMEEGRCKRALSIEASFKVG